MKREMEENYVDSNCEEQQQQEEQSISPNQGNMEYEQDSNDFSESNNATNTNQDNGPTNPPKRQRLTDDEEVRLLIPSKLAGAIIGKGGQNIQKLRTEYKAQVNVGDCQGPERVITIASNLDTCCKIIKDIMKHFDKGTADEYELRILIHQSLAGCVIGKSGVKIKELKDRIGCRLKIFSNIAPHSTDRIAQVIGKEDQCIESFLEIMELIKGTPIKGPIHNYDPHNFDDMYADEYGGYGSGTNGNYRNGSGGGGAGGSSGNGRFAGNERGGRGYNDRGGRSFNDRRNGGSSAGRNGNGSSGNNNGTNNNSSSTMREFVDPWASTNQMGGGNSFGSNNSTMSIGSLMGNSGNQNGNMFGGNGNANMDIDGKTSTQVTIPKDLAGAIIGKGGGRIRRIRSESSAFIQIDEALPGSSDRIITITGTPKQIQMAQYMLQQSIRDGQR